MKSEHRHELKEHELGKLTSKAQAFFEKYGNQLLLGALGVLLVVGGAVFWIRSSAASKADAWQQLLKAGNAEQFSEVAEKYAGTEVAQWARLNVAETYLDDAREMMFTNSTGRDGALEKAEKAFDTVLKSTPLTDPMRERALYGLARTREMSAGKDTAEAVRAYESFAKEFETSPYAAEAKRRAEELQRKDTKDFYAWFQAQDLKPSDIRMPRDFRGMVPPGHPPFGPGAGTTPGDLPDFFPPGLTPPTTPPTGGAPAEAEIPEPPKEGEAK
jgi:hypothetical protein